MSIDLSIIFPIYNEVKSLEHVVKTWDNFLKNNTNINFELLLCEDGSKDGTKELIIELCTKYNAINLSTEERRGYGGAIIAGMNYASSDYIMCIDSDGQCMPDSFLSLWDIRDKSDIIIGNRKPRKDPFIRKVYSFFFKILHTILFNSKVIDPSCPYIIFKNKNVPQLIPYMKYMKEGFWWGFIGAVVKLKLSISQKNIIHYARYDGSTVVYKLAKMPSIIIRNIIGLIKLRFDL